MLSKLSAMLLRMGAVAFQFSPPWTIPLRILSGGGGGGNLILPGPSVQFSFARA